MLVSFTYALMRISHPFTAAVKFPGQISTISAADTGCTATRHYAARSRAVRGVIVQGTRDSAGPTSAPERTAASHFRTVALETLDAGDGERGRGRGEEEEVAPA